LTGSDDDGNGKLMMPIEEMNLSARTTNALINNDIRTINDLVTLSEVDRKKEMKWLQKCGVKGLKVDFFGSDKQQMMGLYEDILTDANEIATFLLFLVVFTVILKSLTIENWWQLITGFFVIVFVIMMTVKLVDKADNKTENPLLPAMKQGPDYEFNYGNLQYFQQKLDNFQKANPQARCSYD
jgi:hypothetical protein